MIASKTVLGSSDFEQQRHSQVISISGHFSLFNTDFILKQFAENLQLHPPWPFESMLPTSCPSLLNTLVLVAVNRIFSYRTIAELIKGRKLTLIHVYHLILRHIQALPIILSSKKIQLGITCCIYLSVCFVSFHPEYDYSLSSTFMPLRFWRIQDSYHSALLIASYQGASDLDSSHLLCCSLNHLI